MQINLPFLDSDEDAEIFLKRIYKFLRSTGKDLCLSK
jgi:hypothetical protein